MNFIKDELIEKLINLENEVEYQCVTQVDLANMKCTASVLKSEFYLTKSQFESQAECFYYVNRTQALMDKITILLDYQSKLFKVMKRKFMEGMSKEEVAVFC